MRISVFTYWFTWKQRPHHFVDAMLRAGNDVSVYSNQSVASLVRRMLRREIGPSTRVKNLITNLLLPSPKLDRIPFVPTINGVQRGCLLSKFCLDSSEIHVFSAVPFEELKIKPSFLIYDCMDDWSDFPEIPKTAIDNERHLCEMADRIWVVSKHLYCKLLREFGEKLDYVPNGVDYDHFSHVPMLKKPHLRPVLGYVGALHTWFDAQLVAEVADKLPDWDIILVGPNALNSKQQQLLTKHNVCFLGRQSYEALPAVMADFDVAMIPFVLNDLIKGTSPIKLYEYLAAGLPVVSTSMPEVVVLNEPGIVVCADDPYTFAQAALDLKKNDSTAMRERRQLIARQHTWQARFENALANLGL